MNELEQKIEKLLEDVSHLIENFQPEDIEKLVAYYDTMEICAKKSCQNVSLFDISYRVALCQCMDQCLNRIIDYVDSYGNISGNIYTPAIHQYRTWENVELMKDKCLTGYMLGKELNATNYQYFCDEKQSYLLAEDLTGLELIFAEKTNEEVYESHLKTHYPDMDVLILHGLHDQTMGFLEQYRKLRPDGKVYCALDLNSHWMAKIPWKSKKVQNFFHACDVVTTSCTSLRDKLNGNPDVNFICGFIPNGFYNPTEIPIEISAKKKENTILTVGRIGSLQKNHMELVLGFAGVAHLLPSWKLKLVGTVEDSFLEFLDMIYKEIPSLRKQIQVLGPIMDKNLLYREYGKAKIFALSSQLEGGSPNVFAEALFHGCKFVTSDIDAADDMTNFGTLGEVYPRGKEQELGKKLLKLCQERGNSQGEEHIQKALAYGDKEFTWERNAKKIAYMLIKPSVNLI